MACVGCEMRKQGHEAAGTFVVDVRALCSSCVEHLTAIRLVASRCDFNTLEASSFVDDLPVHGAGAILSALAFKMVRSWGEEKTREIMSLKIDQALDTLSATPTDA